MDARILEDFVLADDHDEALGRLVPGTEDHSVFCCLLMQRRGALDEAAALLSRWPSAHGWTQRYHQMQARQELLRVGQDPDAGCDALASGASLSHARQLPGQASSLPSALSPREIDASLLTEQWLKDAVSLAPFSDLGRRALLDRELPPHLRGELLVGLQLPDHPALVDRIAADLTGQIPRRFGELHIHAALTLEQMQALGERIPALYGSSAFVEQWLSRLSPGDEPPGLADEVALADRALAFVERLSPAFDGTKAEALYRRILLDRRLGEVHAGRLRAYLELTHASWHQRTHQPVPPPSMPPRRGALAAAGAEEAALREQMLALLGTESHEPFAHILEAGFLLRLVAEARLLAGAPEQARWVEALGPQGFQAIKARVELELSPTNPAAFGADDDVSLSIDLKNISSLVIRVFEIDAVNHFRAHGGEVPIDVDLDGFVPNHEEVHRIDLPPARRARLSFALPALRKAGTYVVDFVGGGKNCRALVRKGRLRALTRTCAAGVAVAVIDDQGRKVEGARLWLQERAFDAESDGEIVVPFSTSPGPRAALLQGGDVVCLARVHLIAEAYSLRAAFHVEREDLIEGAEARLLIRPTLLLQGTPVSLSLLQDARLTLVSVDHRGATSSRTYEGLSFDAGGETVVTFTVPPGVARLQLDLRGWLASVSGSGGGEVSASHAIELNRIVATTQITWVFLERDPGGYGLRVLGRTGEPVAGARVDLGLRHRWFARPIDVALASDEAGRIALGPLPEVTEIEARFGGHRTSWQLRTSLCRLPAAIHARAGEPIRLPFEGSGAPLRRRVTLLACGKKGYTRDAFSHVALEGGFLRIDGLEPGAYDLRLHEENARVEVRVVAGAAVGGWLASDRELLGPTPHRAVAIARLEQVDRSLRIGLSGASSRARVHVLASSFVHPMPSLDAPAGPGGARQTTPPLESRYASGRGLGDETRYVLDRKLARKFPGNMLPRAGLLLHPWSIGETTQSHDEGRLADEILAKAAAQGAVWGGVPEAKPEAQADRGAMACLDFLPQPALVLANLRPDERGEVTVPLDALGGRGVVRVLVVDGPALLCREVAVGPLRLAPRDLRLRTSLDPAAPCAMRDEVSLLQPGDELRLEGSSEASFEVYDSVERALDLLRALRKDDASLLRFGFVARWHALDEAEKRKHYSDSACHELHYFLFRKDRPFFDRVVAPLLACKLHPTFLDRYLLGGDLSAYRGPTAMSRLNALERILLAERLGELDDEHRHQGDCLDARRSAAPLGAPQFQTALMLGGLASRPAPAMRSALSAPAPANMPGFSGPPGLPPPAPAAAPAPAAHAMASADAPDAFGGEPQCPDDAPFAEITDEDIDTLFSDDEPAEQARAELDVGRRARARSLYREVGATRALVEQNYLGRRGNEAGPGLVPMQPFWLDFAAFCAASARGEGGGVFLSRHLPLCASSFTEAMFALAVLDVPFAAGAHALRREEAGVALRAASPAIVFHRQIKPTAAAAPPATLAQGYLRAALREQTRGAGSPDVFDADELLCGEEYLCQVVLTNPTARPEAFDLLLQAPEGSVSLGGAAATRGERVQLAAYETRALEYSFYFPAAGAFAHYPAQLSQDGQARAAAPARPLSVVRTRSTFDRSEWPYLSQAGSDDEVIEALRTRNLQTLQLDLIAWRLRDRSFYDRAMAVLERRRAFAPGLWAYALLHRDLPRVAEWVRSRGVDKLRPFAIEEGWLQVDPVEQGWYEQIEYAPLVNPRAHGPLGPKKILNDALASQYERLLWYLCGKRSLGAQDRLLLTCFLLLQDRIEEALAMFARVDPAQVQSRLQHDYLRAYLAFYGDDPGQARAAAAAHAEHPVERWRMLFAEVLAQLDEAEGGVPRVTDPDDRDQRQAQQAAVGPAIELRAEGGAILLAHRSAPRCEVRFYRMDIELLFSNQPFGLQAFRNLAIVRPSRVIHVEPGLGEGSMALDIPEELRGKNLLVEARSGEARATLTFTASDLSVQVTEAYGQLRVVHAPTGAPLPRVYVKVYARKQDGQEAFYKDGYTDLRGRFDYASVSGESPSRVASFALLALSEAHGAAVREVGPPTR